METKRTKRQTGESYRESDESGKQRRGGTTKGDAFSKRLHPPPEEEDQN